MKHKLLVTTMFVLLTLAMSMSGAEAQDSASQPAVAAVAELADTAFTYQGHFTDGGVPPSGTVNYDFRFTLYTAPSGGSQVGRTILQVVEVRDGLFTTTLDFGDNVFNGNERYLEISVRPVGSSDPHTPLSPRQRLTPAPYALALPGVVPIDTAIRFGSPDDYTDLYWGDGKLSFRNQAGNKLLTISRNDGHMWVNGLKPVRIIRFENIGNDGDVDTGVLESEYFCIAAGWSAHYNIKGGDANNNMVWTYVQGATWRVKVSFASQLNDENPDVDIVCFRREIAAWDASGAPPTLNDPN